MAHEEERARPTGAAAEMAAGTRDGTTATPFLPRTLLSFEERNDKGQRKDKLGNAVVTRIARRFLSFCPFVLFFRNLSVCACVRARNGNSPTFSEKNIFNLFFEKKGQKDKGNAERRTIKGAAGVVV